MGIICIIQINFTLPFINIKTIYSTPAQKAHVMQSFQNHVLDMMKHASACEVLQYAYNEFANAQQRTKICAEFLGHILQISGVDYFLTGINLYDKMIYVYNVQIETSKSLTELVKLNENKKQLLMKNFATNLINVSSKFVCFTT